MNKKAKRSTVVSITVLSVITLLLVSMTLAFLTDSRSTLNILGIGKGGTGGEDNAVQIALTEKEFGANATSATAFGTIAGEYSVAKLTGLVPGEIINKDSVIENVGLRDVYVRFNFTDADGDAIDFTAAPYSKMDFELSSQWKKIGDYYYYMAANGTDAAVLEPEDTIAVFVTKTKGSDKYTIELSTSITNADLAALDGMVELQVNAEAIQADYFTPNMGSTTPWGNEEILPADRG